MRNLSLSLFIAFSLSSCATLQKNREIKKDAKAMGRVLSNPDLIEPIGKIWIGMNPVNQTPVYIKGKDTTIYQVDSIPYFVVDSVLKDCPKLNRDSLIKLFTRTVYKHTTDTLKFPDTSTIRLLNISLKNQSFTQGKLEQSEKQNAEYKKDNSKLRTWSWIERAIAVVIIGFLVFVIFKKK